MISKDIFQYIRDQELAYGQEIEILPNWNWCMKDHIQNSILMKHGKFLKATNVLESKSPYKNIIYPLLNLRYRAEDIDLRDVVLYVDDPEKFHISFLVKKYHDDVYVLEHDLDTLFDETKEEKIDLGGTLVRKGKDGWTIEPLDSIAFCDQTSILSGPIGFKMFFSPDEILDTSTLGWGKKENGADTTLDEIIVLSKEEKDQDRNKSRKTETPGKYIEIYRVHGSFPESWLEGEYHVEKDEKYCRQMWVVGFYKNDKGIEQGVTLYKKKEYESPFKLHLSGKKIRNRALAYGGVEELIDPQIWTNYSEIHKKEILTAFSKVIRWTDDESLSNRNNITDMDNNEMLVLQKGSQVGVLQSSAPNIALFNEWIREWDLMGQSTSGATDALLGERPPSGTPFRLENLVTQQGQGLHDYRKGKFALFIHELYTDGILPDIAKEITKGVKFLATLSPDEMEYVADCLVRGAVGEVQKERVLNGQMVMSEEEKMQFEAQVREEFARGGNRRFIEILKEDFKDIEMKVKVNVAGKNKDLAGIVDKLVNIFRQIFADPTILQDPKAVKVLNKIIEYSGLDPIDFGYASMNKQPQPQLPQPMQGQAPQGAPSPMQPQPAMV